jgi:hypothetical protein
MLTWTLALDIKDAFLIAPNRPETISILSPGTIPEFSLPSQRKRKSIEIGESSSTPVMASEESSELSELSDLSEISPPGSSGTSLGAGRVHVDAGNLPIYTATNQTPTSEDNDPPSAGVFGDRDGNTGKKNDLWSRRNIF